MINARYFYSRKKCARNKGSAIIETAVGLFILVPIFLILLDIIALVVGQTINDDIAKKAARRASEQSDAILARQAADDYMNTIAYTGPTGLVCGARISGFDWNTDRVRVVTEVTINLPVAVPFGGPASQIMQTQMTEATVGVTATPPVGAGS
jgi:hypothetical protein